MSATMNATAPALGYTDWEHREIEAEKKRELFAANPVCDHCGHPIAFASYASVIYINRLGMWFLVHAFGCGMEATLRENAILRGVEAP